MRVAALYDIHGNLPALEAVLDEVRRSGADRIVVGGDVMPGPMTRDTLVRLLDLDIAVQFIHGNGESAVLAHLAGEDLGELPDQAREAVDWVAGQLGPDHQSLIRSWPGALRVEITGSRDVLFCHATPRSDTEIFTRLTPENRLRPMFEGLDVAMVVCGHTHMQFDRTVGSVRVVNAGSVGLPFGAPGAYWLLLGPGVEFRHTAFDLAGAARRIRETDYPQAEDFAARHVLEPPSEEEMLQLFSGSDSK